MSAELREVWTCTTCTMRVYNACGDPIPRPAGWVGDRCPACLAEEDPEAEARRLLLTGMKPMAVSRRCDLVPMARVTELHEEMVASGELDPTARQKPWTKEPKKKKAKPKSKPTPPKPEPSQERKAAEELLRRDPAMTNKEVAARVVANEKQVGKWRRAIGLPTSEQARREEAKALLTADPTLRNADVKGRMRYPVSSPVIRKLRIELGIRPPTERP